MFEQFGWSKGFFGGNALITHQELWYGTQKAEINGSAGGILFGRGLPYAECAIGWVRTARVGGWDSGFRPGRGLHALRAGLFLRGERLYRRSAPRTEIRQ